MTSSGDSVGGGSVRKLAQCHQNMGKMEFILEKVMKGYGVRQGRILWSSSSLNTPLCLVHTRGGSTPNLTRDLEEQVLKQHKHQSNQPGHMTGSVCGDQDGGENTFMLTMPSLYMK